MLKLPKNEELRYLILLLYFLAMIANNKARLSVNTLAVTVAVATLSVNTLAVTVAVATLSVNTLAVTVAVATLSVNTLTVTVAVFLSYSTEE